MLLRKHLQPLMMATAMLAPPVVLGQPSGPRNVPGDPLPLMARVQPGETVGNETVNRVFLGLGTNEFVFVMPPDLHPEGARPGIIILASDDAGYSLTLRVLQAGGSDSSAAEVEACQKRTLARFLNPRKVERFTFSVAGRPGLGVQALQDVSVGERLTKTLWVPCDAGVLEFELTTTPAQARPAMQTMDQVLLTFRSNEKGKLEIIRRSEQT